MTGQFKSSSGTAPLPGITFTSEATSGFFRKSAGVVGITILGVEVGSLSASGLTINGIASAAGIGFTPIGSGMDYWGATAPAGWLFSYGQVLSQTTYAALYAVFGTTYNTGGEGAGNFRMPDKRGRVSAVVDNLGGTTANRLVNGSMSTVRHTLGGAGGADTNTLAAGALPANIPNTATSISATRDGLGNLVFGGTNASGKVVNSATESTVPVGNTQIVTTTTTTVAINPSGGGAHDNLQPTILCNYIIFAGA